MFRYPFIRRYLLCGDIILLEERYLLNRQGAVRMIRALQ